MVILGFLYDYSKISGCVVINLYFGGLEDITKTEFIILYYNNILYIMYYNIYIILYIIIILYNNNN